MCLPSKFILVYLDTELWKFPALLALLVFWTIHLTKKCANKFLIVEGHWLVSWIQFEEFEELLAWMRVSLSCFKSVSSCKSDSLSAYLLKLAQNRPELHWDPQLLYTDLKVSEVLSCYWKMKLVLLLVLVSYSQHWSGGLHCFTVTNNSWLWVTVSSINGSCDNSPAGEDPLMSASCGFIVFFFLSPFLILSFSYIFLWHSYIDSM